jgi:putative transposase
VGVSRRRQRLSDVLASDQSEFLASGTSGERIRESRRNKGERGIWQRRCWEHLIRDDLDRQRHIDSVHDNPVKQGDVQRAIDCRFSSFHRDLQHG